MNKLKQLAKLIINYSLRLKKGQQLFLEVVGEENYALGRAISDYANKKGVKVIFREKTQQERYDFWKKMTHSSLKAQIEVDSNIMKQSNGYCSVSGESTLTLPEDKQKLKDEYFLEVHQKIRLKKPWVLTQVPNEELAKRSEVKMETLNEIYYRSCLFNFKKVKKSLDNLKELMERTNNVRIISPNTDISFSIKDIPVVPCLGQCNLPDGEIFTAPVKTSVNGTITYNTPSRHNGVLHKNISLTFINGKIIKATSDHTEQLKTAFDTDEGARYVGEFSLGFNKNINFPVGSILFDEKIGGSLHFTPGASYDEAPNGNQSALHWDLVLIQTAEYGGGEIYFDDVLIRKDGKFLAKNLSALN